MYGDAIKASVTAFYTANTDTPQNVFYIAVLSSPIGLHYHFFENSQKL